MRITSGGGRAGGSGKRWRARVVSLGDNPAVRRGNPPGRAWDSA